MPWQKKILLAFIPLLASASFSYAQSVKGAVTSIDKKPVAAANVLLLQSKDSVLLKGMVTEETGSFLFSNIPPGSYILQISFTGFEDMFSSPIVLDKSSIDLGTFQLKETGIQLEKVIVTAKKPLFEQKIDRMVVNVKNSITAAGGSALDVLEKSPGIIVNRQNNTISMNGKDGVVIMINGKVNKMPVSAVVQLLSGMTAGNIEKIELITTPPANFDAEGNAGFINIVLINNPNQGLNGSYSLALGYGKGEAPAASINFNYRHNKINLYGDYSFSRLHTKQLFTNFRRVEYQGDVIESYAESDRNTFQRNHNVSIGLDYELNKKTVAGVLIGTYNNKWSMDARNHMSKTVNSLQDSSTTIINDEINHWKHYMADVNIMHRFKEGQFISFDVNYLWYEDKNPTDYTNNYYNAQGNFLSSDMTKSGKVTPISFWVGTSDYTAQLGKKWKLETGIKLTISRFNNDVIIERYSQNNWVKDPDLTANYHLKENIGAAYTSFSGDLDNKTGVKLGLRYEYTTSNLGTATTANIVDRKYGRLFPTFFISRKLDDDNSLNFSYSRRITRPTFNDLAPFIIFLDPNTFFSGNAALQPAIIDGIKTDYLFKNYIFSLGYSIETNTIAGFQVDVDVATNKQYMRAQNLDKTKIFNASFSLPFTITKWWSMQSNITGNWQQVHAMYKNNPVKVAQAGVNVFVAQTFKLPKDYTLELSGFYSSPGLFGIARFDGLGRIDVGAQKKIGSKGGSLKFSITDLLQSMLLRAWTDMPDQHFYTETKIRFAYRTYRLTWTCPFGSKGLKDKRSRSTGSEDERNRIQ